MLRLQPELAWIGGRFRTGVVLEVENGSITRVALDGATADSANVVRLPGRALMPGMVNAHSHAFQRLIRGHTQWKPAGNPRADFWSWREAMYASLAQLTPEDVYAVSRFAFTEMLLAGYTSVGEFHYLQRDVDGSAYEDPNELAHAVIRAARDVGIRMALLNVCYAQGGIGQPLQPQQRRFATPDLDAFMAATGQLAEAVSQDAMISVGVAPHSVRAVRRDWLPPLAQLARQLDAPLHMHLSEQPAEVASSVEQYGLRPVEVAAEEGLLSQRFTAIHATHVTEQEIRLFAESGSTVCVCPSTERDLGDGIAQADRFQHAGVPLAIGTDSQTVIDPWEELRCLEYHTRLVRLERVVLSEAQDEKLQVATPLLRVGTADGAAALRLRTGELAVGQAADFITIDLDHYALAGWTVESLPAMLALSGSAYFVRDVWVGGERVVADRAHDGLGESYEAFVSVAEKVFG